MQDDAGNRLNELRSRRGLSLRSVADELHVHESTVSRWESGATIPDAHKQHLAEFFGVSVSYLMRWDAHEDSGNGHNGEQEGVA